MVTDEYDGSGSPLRGWAQAIYDADPVNAAVAAGKLHPSEVPLAAALLAANLEELGDEDEQSWVELALAELPRGRARQYGSPQHITAAARPGAGDSFDRLVAQGKLHQSEVPLARVLSLSEYQDTGELGETWVEQTIGKFVHYRADDYEREYGRTPQAVAASGRPDSVDWFAEQAKQRLGITDDEQDEPDELDDELDRLTQPIHRAIRIADQVLAAAADELDREIARLSGIPQPIAATAGDYLTATERRELFDLDEAIQALTPPTRRARLAAAAETTDELDREIERLTRPRR